MSLGLPAAATPEAREGLNAFVQKRAPDWASVAEQH